MTFRHPANNYTVTVNHAGAWCLLFGSFYFIKHNVWSHALIGFVAAFFTFGISWFLVYPFLARGIVRKAYLSKGWIEVDAGVQPPAGPSDRAREADAGRVAAAFHG